MHVIIWALKVIGDNEPMTCEEGVTRICCVLQSLSAVKILKENFFIAALHQSVNGRYYCQNIALTLIDLTKNIKEIY